MKMANAKTTKKTSPKTETEKAVVKENLTTEKAEDSVDKITTYDEYLASDEMARKRFVYEAQKEEDEN